MKLTFETQVVLPRSVDAEMAQYAQQFCEIERKLFSEMNRVGKVPAAQKNELKRRYLKQYGITGRQYNALRTTLEGRIEGIKALQKNRKADLIHSTKELAKDIAAFKRRIDRLAKTGGNPEVIAKTHRKLHGKQRRLMIKEGRLDALNALMVKGRVSLAFGGKRLFKAQYELEKNGYANHGEWKADWNRSRHDQFFVLGSKDETTGNQSCQATGNEDGTLNLKLRLLDSMVEGKKQADKYLHLTDINLHHGAAEILAALDLNQAARKTKSLPDKAQRVEGQAITYRFQRSDKRRAWRVLICIDVPETKLKTNAPKLVGTLGVDLNADHLAVCETDRYGNPIRHYSLPCCTYGLSADRRKAVIADALKALTDDALATGKALVIEDLNFAKKKQGLRKSDPKQARMLSSFFYTQFQALLASKCHRLGIELLKVSPAYSSIIGQLKWQHIKGYSRHHAAACVLARRGMGLEEKPSRRMREHLGKTVKAVLARSPGKTDHVDFQLPERKAENDWMDWWRSVWGALTKMHVAYRVQRLILYPT